MISSAVKNSKYIFDRLRAPKTSRGLEKLFSFPGLPTLDGSDYSWWSLFTL